MKCASCARDTPLGARYCVHCGAEQTVPTPIAAVAAAAAAMGSRPPRQLPQAANAAQADPAVDEHAAPTARQAPDPWPGAADRPQGAKPDDAGRTSLAADTRSLAGAANRGAASASSSETAPARVGPATPPRAGVPGSAAVPAYASTPRRAGLAVLLVALCFAVAWVAFAGWRMFSSEPPSGEESASQGGDESVMSLFPPDATPQRPRLGAPPAQSPVTLPAQEPAAGGRETSSAAGVASSDSAAAPTPVEIKPLPAKPARKPAKRPAKAQPQPQPQPQSQPKAPPAAPESSPPAARAPAVAAAPVVAPLADRWARMKDELSRCTREDFITRVICDQRVRFKYCDGYWGKLAQCPGNPVPDRGQ